MAKVHSSAVVDKSVELDEQVEVGPNCVIDKRVSIGAGTTIGANVVIDQDVKIGRGNRFFCNCSIGGQPQILGLDADKPIGGLVIGDNNVFREQVTIHPSIYEGKNTKIGNNNLLMIGVHIGHDCELQDDIVMSNYAQLSGHCRIESGVWLSGMVLLHQFVTIGKWCYAAGMAGINKDVPPFLIVSGHYPPRVRGVNKRGLERAGMSEQQQQQIIEAYRRIYRGNGSVVENARAMAEEGSLDENVQAMVDMITKSSQQRFGRYLERHRE